MLDSVKTFDCFSLVYLYMNPKIKKFLKRTFPLGLLVAAERIKTKIFNKFRYIDFLKDWKVFTETAKSIGDNRFVLSSQNLFPILHEKTRTQDFDRHYTYHPAWASRKISEIKPELHIDISSTLTFSTIVSAFVPVKFYDYRPAELALSNFSSGAADLLHLPFEDNSIKSLSCMHTLEHIGLGRYGDPIDPIGDLKAMKELQRVLSVGGDLLVVMPVGKPIVQFNSQRIYAYNQVLDAFSTLKIKEFTLLTDDGQLIMNADPSLVEKQVYGCGCFWFTK